tara:strand:- start:57 stop:380 length:324 start_codon:yes stop_codon:yes gene_type:complete
MDINNLESDTLKTPNLLEGDSLITFDSSTIKQYLKDNTFKWNVYRETSKRPDGFFQVSNVSINNNNTKSALKLVVYNDKLAAGCYLILFEKINNKWIIKGDILLWMS